MRVEDAHGRRCPALQRGGARHAVGVQRVDVAPGGEHAAAVAQQVAASLWRNVLAVEGAERAAQLLRVERQQLPDLHRLRQLCLIDVRVVAGRREEGLQAGTHRRQPLRAILRHGVDRRLRQGAVKVGAEVLSHLRLRGWLAQHVQPLREQPALNLQQIRVEPASKLKKVLPRHLICCLGRQHHLGALLTHRKRAVLLQPAQLQVLDNRCSQCVIGHRILAVLRQQLAQRGHLLVQPRAAVGRHVVADNGAVAAALGDDGLRGVVARVDVDVGQVAQQRVAPGDAGVAQRRAGQPLHRAVHPEVHHRGGLVLLLQPLVKCRVLWVRGEVALKEQPHRVALHAQEGLHADPHIAALHARDDVVAGSRGGNAAVALQPPPLALHALHQDVRLRQERDGTPVRGAVGVREPEQLLQAAGAHLRSGGPHAGALRRVGAAAVDALGALHQPALVLLRLERGDDGLAVNLLSAAHRLAQVVPLRLQRLEQMLQ
mmetsp:Transcript_19938/g.52037  ORF Transcript_19938/g.52037 Transcript_19938/m.52037 type:complete len:487 (-) Transcript_19938:796-2256(-)